MLYAIMKTLRRYSAESIYGEHNAAVLRAVEATRRCVVNLLEQRLTITRVTLDMPLTYMPLTYYALRRTVIEIQTPPPGVELNGFTRIRRRAPDGTVEVVNVALIDDCEVQWRTAP